MTAKDDLQIAVSTPGLNSIAFLDIDMQKGAQQFYLFEITLQFNFISTTNHLQFLSFANAHY